MVLMVQHEPHTADSFAHYYLPVTGCFKLVDATTLLTEGCCWLCSIHVASVVQMTLMLLVHGGIMKSRAFARIHLLSAYWSAAVHDYEHGGLNNDFLIKTAHPLAITYNDISPFENHHLSAAIRVLHIPECSYIPVRLMYLMKVCYTLFVPACI